MAAGAGGAPAGCRQEGPPSCWNVPGGGPRTEAQTARLVPCPGTRALSCPGRGDTWGPTAECEERRVGSGAGGHSREKEPKPAASLRRPFQRSRGAAGKAERAEGPGLRAKLGCPRGPGPFLSSGASVSRCSERGPWRRGGPCSPRHPPPVSWGQKSRPPPPLAPSALR